MDHTVANNIYFFFRIPNNRFGNPIYSNNNNILYGPVLKNIPNTTILFFLERRTIRPYQSVRAPIITIICNDYDYVQ